MSIRKAGKQDVKPIYSIYSYYVETTPYNFDARPMNYATFEKKMDTILSYPCYVACHDDQIIGYAYVQPAFTKEAYRYCMEVSIYFAPGKHYGLANELYQTLEKECKERKYRWMISCITDSNTKSISFHQRHGYFLQGSLPDCGLKFDSWHGVVWMCKDLYEHRSYYQSSSAVIVGDVKIGESASIGDGAVLKGNDRFICIGSCTHIRENCVVCSSKNNSVTIGNRVTIENDSILHGCMVEDAVWIGDHVTIMDGAYIKKNTIIEANSLIPSGMIVPEGCLVTGAPAKIKQKLGVEQIQEIIKTTKERE